MDHQDKQGRWWHWKSKGPEIVVLAHVHQQIVRRAYRHGIIVGALVTVVWHLVCFILLRLWRSL